MLLEETMGTTGYWEKALGIGSIIFNAVISYTDSFHLRETFWKQKKKKAYMEMGNFVHLSNQEIPNNS